MSQAVLDFNVEPNFEAGHENISDAAQSASAGEQVYGCKAALREILALQAEAKAYAGALESLSHSYQASLEDHKFAELIEQRKQLIEQQNPYSASQDPVYTAFVQDLEQRGGDGAGPARDEDEDVAEVNTQWQVANNSKCPITGRPVLELEEPVEDEMGYVYEKAAILAHINNFVPRYRGQQVPCPVAATNHILRKDKLRRAARVIKEQKRLKRGGGAQGASESAEDILDV